MAPSKSSTIFLLLIVLISSSLGSISCAKPVPKTNTRFIITSCQATTYPKLCFSSLSSHASDIQTSPKLMATSALSVALDTARSTTAMMVKLSKSHGMKPREAGAVRDCLEEMADTVDEIGKSIGEMKEMRGSDFGMMISDVQTWVSAALTDENTCMDGFGGSAMNGSVKDVVRGKIVNIAQLTSNAWGFSTSNDAPRLMIPHQLRHCPKAQR